MNIAASMSTVMVALCVLVVTCSPAFAIDTEDLRERLGRVEASHPRLFFSEREESKLREKIEADPLLKAAFDHLQRGADAAQKSTPVKRDQVGKRLLGVSRTCLQRVSYLAFTHRLTGSEACLRRAAREMLAAAAFEDWNPSHFLDVAEMTAALAIGYDWLYDELEPEARETIRAAIVDKGLETSLRGGGWVTTTNNWNQVCHGGLVLGALAVLEDEPELAEKIVTRALENLPRAMREYEPDGVYPEGPTYWKYGTTYNAILISALESVLGSDFGLASAPGFMASPEFYLHAAGPTGMFFNFSDCGLRGGIAPAMHWFAARRQDASLLWREKEALASFAAQESASNRSWDRMLAFLLIWGRPMGDIAPPAQLHWQGGGRTPIAIHRSGWDTDATFAGIKGGSPGSNHAHMDTGTFVVDMAGVRWAIDLGAQSYHNLESQGVDLWNRSQESERWTVFRLNNLSHNTLVVDGQPQRVKGNAPIISFSDDHDAPHTVVDMSVAYEGQLNQARRGLRLVGKSVLLQDEVKTLAHETHVRWGMATEAAVTLSDNGAAVLKQDGKTMTLRVLSPEGSKLAVYDMEKPPSGHDAKNPNTRMVGFEAGMAASSAATFAVFLESDGNRSDVPAIRSLADW